MIIVDGQDGDAFLGWVGRIISGASTIAKAEAVHVVQLDHWFDQKWLEFSGKALGAVGVWKASVTVPPFHPNRVRAETHYRRIDGSEYVLVSDGPRLHREQTSSQNLQRRLSLIAPNTACYWYSGDGTTVGRAALMGYVPVGEELSTWYVGAKREGSSWTPETLVGIGAAELVGLAESGALRAG